MVAHETNGTRRDRPSAARQPLSDRPFSQSGSWARSVRPSPSLSRPSVHSFGAIGDGGLAFDAGGGGGTAGVGGGPASPPLVSQSGSCAVSVRPSSSLSRPSEHSGPGS